MRLFGSVYFLQPPPSYDIFVFASRPQAVDEESDSDSDDISSVSSVSDSSDDEVTGYSYSFI